MNVLDFLGNANFYYYLYSCIDGFMTSDFQKECGIRIDHPKEDS